MASSIADCKFRIVYKRIGGEQSTVCGAMRLIVLNFVEDRGTFNPAAYSQQSGMVFIKARDPQNICKEP